VKFAPGGAETADQINNPHFSVGIDCEGELSGGGETILPLADLQKFCGRNKCEWKAPVGIDTVNKWVKIKCRIIQIED